MPNPLHRTWQAQCSLDLLLEGLSPARVPDLHPLIHSIHPINPEKAEYWLEESVPFGPFSIPNRYKARWDRTAPDALRMEAWSRPAVTLRHDLRFEALPGCVRVAHTVSIEAPFLLRAFVERTAHRAHEAWVLRVRAWTAAEAIRRAAGGSENRPIPDREGHRLVAGERHGQRWEILVNGDGPLQLRLPGFPADPPAWPGASRADGALVVGGGDALAALAALLP